MAGNRRLIESAFCLRQASLDSVHEKMCHAGHIKALHIWPARRPLAACRAALIATLLPDPGNDDERHRLVEKMGGRVVQRVQKKKVGGRTIEKIKEETLGGILHWGRENGPDLEFFRQEIRKAYGGRAPKVLDPFAGGGAIPLEAMRLGCEVTASDINPVAWFILKCTLEYPQKLAGKYRPLPDFAVKSPRFMEEYLKATLQGTGKTKKRRMETALEQVQQSLLPTPDADLAWHVRAWGHWVLERARKDLAKFYPVVDGKPTLAYLWARTVKCKNCRATIPFLKTLWLCKKDNKRVKLEIKPNKKKTRVEYSVVKPPPAKGNPAQRREHDRRIGQGTMSRSGAWCPCCGSPGTVAMTMDDIRHEGVAGRLGCEMTAVVVKGDDGKEFRLPKQREIRAIANARGQLDDVFGEIPFGAPAETMANASALGFRVPLYGFDRWDKLFTPRQFLALGTFVKHAREVPAAMRALGYPEEWVRAILSYLACVIDKIADYNSAFVAWQPVGAKGSNTFQRWALPMKWDFVENNTLESDSGGWAGVTQWVTAPLSGSIANAVRNAPQPEVRQESAMKISGGVDAIVTDPPYYDAIPYSDLMDFFHVWLRRILHGLDPSVDEAFNESLAPKWDHSRNDGELIDDPSRYNGNSEQSKTAYEEGMYRAFRTSHAALKSDGCLVIVFAHKNPDAWETLVSAVIRAGFVVDGSWPIQTEMRNRTRALTSAALASSVWLVCKKRPKTARAGWDNRVLEEMRENIYDRLRGFWDAGIRGPDFVWAATGPALEAYSRHPIVKKANEPGKVMEVSEFLRAVRRIVVDFVVGRVLSRNGDGEIETGLDDVTCYYLLHRYDFGFDDAPAGACILYAQSCGLSDGALADTREVLMRTGGKEREAEEEASDEGDEEEGTGSTLKLRKWTARKGKNLGLDTEGRPAPLIDKLHRLMRLWKAGDVHRVDAFLDEHGLRRKALFAQLLQSLIELARHDKQGDELELLETISNHVQARGAEPDQGQARLFKDSQEDPEEEDE